MKKLFFLLLMAGAGAAWSEPGNRFVFTQMEHGNNWDPYPDLWEWASVFVAQNTRLDPWPDRRTIQPLSPALFESPFVVLAGRGRVSWSESDLTTLRHYLSAGGLLFLDDTSATAGSPFSRSVAELPSALFFGGQWAPIPREHAVYRSFFLLTEAAGRRRVSSDLDGFWLADRLVMIFSRNDVLGAVTRDRLGRPLLTCEPGGERQRRDSEKLFINLILFAMTGTYKTDAVHQPFLDRRTRP